MGEAVHVLCDVCDILYSEALPVCLGCTFNWPSPSHSGCARQVRTNAARGTCSAAPLWPGCVAHTSRDSDGMHVPEQVMVDQKRQDC